MKMSEIRDLTEVELQNKARELRDELFVLRRQRRTVPPEKPHRFREIRADVARVETQLNDLRKKKQEQPAMA